MIFFADVGHLIYNGVEKHLSKYQLIILPLIF